MRRVLVFLAFSWLTIAAAATARADEAEQISIERDPSVKPRNVIFILSDDHRYDAMGFAGHPFLKTPQLDALAAGGVHIKNAFVTTSLCSPSRASILTGQYMHNHKVVDNNNPAPPGTIFFPQYMQAAGYETAFVGKWHMGGSSDEPRPGFDHWVSFRGQGFYYPPKNRRWSLNVNGKRVPQKGHISDELTDYAIDWLDGLDGEKPFLLYLSHKAVHAMFEPAERHADLYTGVEIEEPATQANTDKNYHHKPMWVKNQRNSWHGVDFPYHSDLDVQEYYRQYCRTLGGVDDSVGTVMQWLRDHQLDQETLVIYMGDNGFLFGEHGLIDKRNAYEESMRVPMIAHCPELFPAGSVCEGVVANIDVAPTILAAAGVKTPEHMDGADFTALAAGDLDLDQWRQYLLYEYIWEFNFPQTPTMFALRGNKYKFIQYWGVWDLDELYDLENDPQEQNNLIFDAELQPKVRQLREQLYRTLVETGGTAIPLYKKMSHGQNLRRRAGSEVSDFPDVWKREKDGRQ